MEQKTKELLRGVRHVALDMDGTIYMGSNLFPFTIPFLERLGKMGITYSFLTNNPSKSIDAYLQKLEHMGIHATEKEIYNTTIATIDYIHAHYPQAKKLFLLGTPSMTEQFVKAGFVSTADDPDLVCPTNERTILVDCGSICRMLESAAGRKPDITLGKPDPNMLVGIQQQMGLRPEEICMVGDRIYTDIAMAHNAGAVGCLVLSGETTIEVAQQAERQPDIIARDIEQLGDWLAESRE